MFIKEPKQRPSAAELLQTPFILEHRQVYSTKNKYLNITKISYLENSNEWSIRKYN